MAKFLKIDSNGDQAEEATVATSAGAGDNGKVPSLNGSGVLDSTIVNSTVASAGAGSSGKVVALDGAGKLDQTVLPVGIGADTASVVASENLAAGNYVNLFDNAGTPNVRKADNSNGRRAHGFVLSAVTASNPATVYFEGRNTGLTSRTTGAKQFLGTGGLAVEAVPTGTGVLLQVLGTAVSSTSADFALGPVTVRA